MPEQETLVRWKYEIADRATARSEQITKSIVRDVQRTNAALQLRAREQVRASQTIVAALGRESDGARRTAGAVVAADRAVGQSATTRAHRVSDAAAQEVRALRSLQSAHRQAAAAAQGSERGRVASAQASATALGRLRAREADATQAIGNKLAGAFEGLPDPLQSAMVQFSAMSEVVRQLKGNAGVEAISGLRNELRAASAEAKAATDAIAGVPAASGRKGTSAGRRPAAPPAAATSNVSRVLASRPAAPALPARPAAPQGNVARLLPRLSGRRGMAMAGAGLTGAAAAGGLLPSGDVLGGAASGAALGASFGPWGMLAGGVAGALGSAILGAVDDNAKEAGERLGKKVAPGMSKPVRDAALTIERSRQKHANAAEDLSERRVGVSYRTPFGTMAQRKVASPKDQAEARRERALAVKDARSLGALNAANVQDKAGRADGRNMDVKAIAKNALTSLNGLTVSGRLAGARAIVAWAKGMEEKKELPKNAATRLARDLGAKLNISKALAAGGTKGTQALANGLKAPAAVNAARNMVRRIGSQYDGIPKAASGSAKDTKSALGNMAEWLRHKLESTDVTGKARKRMEEDLAALIAAYGEYRTAVIADSGAAAESARGEFGSINQTLEATRQKLEDTKRAFDSIPGTLGQMPSASDAMGPPNPNAGRRGGRFQGGGLVDVLVSSQEALRFPSGDWGLVPGAPVAADNVAMSVPSGTEVYTGHGQGLLAAGYSRAQALAEQLPHFGGGGVAGKGKARTARIGYTTFSDDPPGAFGSLKGTYAELGTATRGGSATGRGWIAKALGLPGELAGRQPLTVTINGHTDVLEKGDRGYGQGGDGTWSNSRFGLDVWKDRWAKFGIGSQSSGSAVVTLGRHAATGEAADAPAKRSTRVKVTDDVRGMSAAEARRNMWSLRRGAVPDAFSQAYEAARGGETDLRYVDGLLGSIKAAARVNVTRTRVASKAKSKTSSGGGSSSASPDNPVLKKMVHRANGLIGKPYVYGGGHGSFNDSGYDCSGLVSALLHSGGFLSAPTDTTGLKSFGQPGSGRLITVGVRGSSGHNAHTMIRVGSRYYEAGGGGAAHNVHRRSGWNGRFDTLRHPPRFRPGGVVGGARVRARGVHPGDARLQPSSPRFLGYGLRGGGKAAPVGIADKAQPMFRPGSTAGASDAVGLASRDSAVLAKVHKLFATKIHGKIAGTIDDLTVLLGDAEHATISRLQHMSEELGAAIRGTVAKSSDGGAKVTKTERLMQKRAASLRSLIDGELAIRAGGFVARADQLGAAADRASGAVDRQQRRNGIDADSTDGISRGISLGSAQITWKTTQRDLLRRALDVAKQRGRAGTDQANELTEQIAQLNDDIDELAVQRIEAQRALVRKQTQDRTDGAQFTLDWQGIGQQALAASQRLAGTDQTPEGMRAMATVQQDAIPKMKAVYDAQVAQAAVAWEQHDAAGWRQAMLAAGQTAIDMSNAQADATETFKAAAERASALNVSAAEFRTSKGQSLYEGFKLDQQLAGTYEGGGAARADFIATTLLPDLQNQREADRLDMETEKRERGAESAEFRAAFLKWMGDDNAIKQLQLDAQEAIKDNTDTKAVGGTLGFSFGGANVTDVLMGNGA